MTEIRCVLLDEAYLSGLYSSVKSSPAENIDGKPDVKITACAFLLDSISLMALEISVHLERKQVNQFVSWQLTINNKS